MAIILDWLLDKGVDFFCNFLKSVIDFLPSSPVLILLLKIDSIDNLSFLNYFIPFDFCALAINSWLVCVGIYYVVKNGKKILSFVQRFL